MDSKTEFVNWVIYEGQVCLELTDGIHNVSANEIFQAEFKGVKTVRNISVASKPSDCLRGVTFRRDLPEVAIEIQIPETSSQNPYVCLSIGASQEYIKVYHIPDGDHVLQNNVWVALAPDISGFIFEILTSVAIEELGPISLQQALELSAVNSEDVKINLTIAPDDNVMTVNLGPSSNYLDEAGFTATMYPYQRMGFEWLLVRAREKLGCMLADEMGLGKTLQIIAAISHFKVEWQKPSMVICPATLLENWRREFNRFSPNIDVLIHAGQGRTPFPSKLEKADVILCSYDTAARDIGMLSVINWGIVALDEAQVIRNPETFRSSMIKSLPRDAGIAVSGTPMQNRLLDLWSLMEFCYPRLLGSLDDFQVRYIENEMGATQLHQTISPLFLRREISEVAQDLPEKVIIAQAINMSEEETQGYILYRDHLKQKYGRSGIFAAFTKLRQYCTHPLLIEDDAPDVSLGMLQSSKYKRTIEILEEVTENGEKAIVFTAFNKMAQLFSDDIYTRFRIPCGIINGTVPVKDRQIIVDEFTEINGPAVLIVNPEAGGTGLNITAANHVIHYTLGWNPAVEDQATARVHRLGQEKPCRVHRLYYPNTVEEVVNEKIEWKRELAAHSVVPTADFENDFKMEDLFRALDMEPSN